VKDNIVTVGISGKFGKDLVSKIINGKTFHTKYPDRSQVKYTKEQAKIQMIFRDAAKFAGDIVNDPVKNANYKKKRAIPCITQPWPITWLYTCPKKVRCQKRISLHS
jgi:hypothetical protein